MKSSVKRTSKISSALLIGLSLATFIPNFNMESTAMPIVSATEISPAEHAEDILETLNRVYPNDLLPDYILTDQTPEYVSAATTGSSDQDNFNIYYYAENEPIGVDDQALNELDPIASFTKESFETTEEAAEAVNQILDLQGQEVDLGYDITGYMQGAAGSTYLNWQEGNWSLIVQSQNDGDNDPVALATEVVEYLEEVYLTPPEDLGQITLKDQAEEGTLENNSVVWQKGNVVYTVQHHDPMGAIRMVGSIETNEEP